MKAAGPSKLHTLGLYICLYVLTSFTHKQYLLGALEKMKLSFYKSGSDVRLAFLRWRPEKNALSYTIDETILENIYRQCRTTISTQCSYTVLPSTTSHLRMLSQVLREAQLATVLCAAHVL